MKEINPKLGFRRLVYLVLPTILAFSAVAVWAQDNSTTNANQTNSNSEVKPTPIPVSEIIVQAGSASSLLKELAAGVEADATAEIVERDLPELTAEIDARLEETGRVIERRASLEKLKNFELEWRLLTKPLPIWKKDLTDRAKKLGDDLKLLATLEEKWKKTQAELAGAETPPEVLASIDQIFTTILETRKQIEVQQARIVALQSKVADEQKRSDEALESIKETRESMVGKLLVQDNPPVWSRDFWTRAQVDISEGANDSFATQTQALNEFAQRNTTRIIVHFLLFVLFAALLIFLRGKAHPWIEKEPDLKTAAIIFYLPVSTALIIAIFLNSWIYPQTPQLLKAIFGAILMIPTVIILRKLVEHQIYPVLYSLVIFYFIDQLRMVAEQLTVVSRVIFLAEMLGGFLFFLWLYRKGFSKVENEDNRSGKIFKRIKTASTIAIPVFAVAFLANAFGFVSLARLIGNAVLKASYVAVIFYAAIRILDGLIIFALIFRPLGLLGMVKQHRLLVQNRARKYLRWIAVALWLMLTLDFLSLREPLFDWVRSIVSTEAKLGSLAISLGDVLAFGLTVWAAFLISRFVRFALEEDIYPRINIARGVPYAISTMLHYVLLLLGFFVALAIIGFDMTKFTILAGAFGVGIGFGLQNIVNNFVSGIILLFERPVNVGDYVQIGTDEGDLRRIGLRASVLRTLQGSEVIVPNGDLISGKVVNWTFSDQQRRIEVNVGVAYGTDPKTVIEILTKVALENEEVMKEPAPRTVFIGFGDSSLDFQLRAWTNNFDSWIITRSDLNVGVYDALNEAGISIPFPQRDLHLVSMDEKMQKSLRIVQEK